MFQLEHRWLSANVAGAVGHFFVVGDTGDNLRGRGRYGLGLRRYLLDIGPFGRIRF